MPRSAAAARRGHHNSNRNENGAAQNGRRLNKQKSNGHLNGNPSSGGSSTAGSQVDLRAPGDSASAATPKTNGVAEASKGDGSDHAYGHHGNGDMAYGQANGAASLDCPASKTAVSFKRTGQSSSVNPFALASTILRSCPMYDTIAILIFLLQLPPIVLTLVQFLFASLTFIPPGGGSASSLTSNFDIFQGAAGSPSFGTMVAMDGFCLLLWGLFMWNWAQNFALDLAHVQVAISLGGGGSGKNGGVNALCVGIVLFLHIIRSKGIQEFVVGHLVSAGIVSPDMLVRWSHLIPPEFRRTEPQASPSWLRSLLAIHILAQAGTAMARRSMARNRSPQPSRTPGKRVDAEAAAGSQAQVDSAFESTASVASVLGADALTGPSVLKESRDRLNSAKKRRRQANQVRSQQPFWAALARTKVTVMREHEHSGAISKTTRGLPMTEDDLQGITLDDGLIWITSVDSSTIRFAAADLASMDEMTSSADDENGHMGNDEEPFYVCVNGALWATATISRETDGPKGSSSVQWRGEISGLAPNCAYTCSFVRSDTDEEICTLSVKTPVAPDADQGAVPAVATPPRPFHRPSSPSTTLKNSIINADAKLHEKRSRLKKAKNDHKMLISRIKKELDNFNHRLSSGNDENRQKQRSLQLERNIRQTEEATAALETQLDNMETIPEEELEEWTAQKADFDRELELLNTAKETLLATRSDVARDLSSLESEQASTVQKRERLQGRKARLNEQFERIISANAQGLNERERRAAEQFAREQDQAKVEANFNEQLASITRAVQDYQVRTNQLWQQASAVEEAIQQQQQQMLMETGPLTPEGNLPGTNPPFEVSNQTSTAGGMTVTPANSRSILGVSFSGLRSSPGHAASSPAPGTSSQTASPLQATMQQSQPYQASPRLSVASYFGRDFAYRDRSSSNRSARSSLYADLDLFDGSRAFPDVERRGSGSDGKGHISPTYGAIGSPFTRAGSQGSGSNSGSGSGSGSGSPRSTRADVL